MLLNTNVQSAFAVVSHVQNALGTGDNVVLLVQFSVVIKILTRIPRNMECGKKSPYLVFLVLDLFQHKGRATANVRDLCILTLIFSLVITMS